MKKILNKLKYNSSLGLKSYKIFKNLYVLLKYKIFSDEFYVKKRFYKSHGYKIDLKNPKTLNEKMVWLKLNDRRNPFYSICADKYAVRDYVRKEFGEEYLIPLVMETNDVTKIIPQNLPDDSFIIKTNHDSAHYIIVKDKSIINWKKVQFDLIVWMSENYYYVEKEWQYKNIKPRVIIEKLLECSNGKIPNDYKLNCINGKVEFIYVSIDREEKNKRNIYSRDWKPLDFCWAKPGKDTSNIRGEEILSPESLSKMIEFSEKVAKNFKYVRVDFYDVDGKLYFGEITLHHGGGYDVITPFEKDQYYGDMLQL
jgi:hypothetical protein